MTIRDAATELGLSYEAIYSALSRGTLKATVPYDPSGRWALRNADISQEEIERYRTEHRGQQGKRKRGKFDTSGAAG